jgi:hypothetical protein
MKVKLGDNLICRKNLKPWYTRDYEPAFTDGKVYEVTSVILGNPNGGGPPFKTLVIHDNNKHMRFLNNDEIRPDTELGRIFITLKQLRKEKLKKIENEYR